MRGRVAMPCASSRSSASGSRSDVRLSARTTSNIRRARSGAGRGGVAGARGGRLSQSEYSASAPSASAAISIEPCNGIPPRRARRSASGRSGAKRLCSTIGLPCFASRRAKRSPAAASASGQRIGKPEREASEHADDEQRVDLRIGEDDVGAFGDHSRRAVGAVRDVDRVDGDGLRRQHRGQPRAGCRRKLGQLQSDGRKRVGGDRRVSSAVGEDRDAARAHPRQQRQALDDGKDRVGALDDHDAGVAQACFGDRVVAGEASGVRPRGLRCPVAVRPPLHSTTGLRRATSAAVSRNGSGSLKPSTYIAIASVCASAPRCDR